MKICPSCGAEASVVETRAAKFGMVKAIRRRRVCSGKCGWRMSTIEIPAPRGRQSHHEQLVLVSSAELKKVADAVRILQRSGMLFEEASPHVVELEVEPEPEPFVPEGA